MIAVRDIARIKRHGFRVHVRGTRRGWEIDCKSTPRARQFEAWLHVWRLLTPELPVLTVVDRAMFAVTYTAQLERMAEFWRSAQPGWTERQVMERAHLDVECSIRFRARRGRRVMG